MRELTIRTLSGGETTLTTNELKRFLSGLDGSVTTLGDAEYETVRPVWNGMVTRAPAMFVHCASEADIQKTVRLARERSLLLGVRGGGHNIAGNALADGGVVADLSRMREVQVDANSRKARVQPGALLGDVDGASQRHGLATPLGINSTTGVAGLTLGGGFGWLSRRFGLTADNLTAVRMVTADGDVVHSNENENAELFWAIRGGGGNFGVVTSFEYRLHPVGPEITAGLIVHPADDAATLLAEYSEAVASAPDELAVWVVMRNAPPLPFLEESVHGQPVVVLAVCHTGSPGDAERALAPFRAIGKPHADVVGPARYADFQQAFDPLLTRGARNYWKTHNMQTLEPGMIDELVRASSSLPGPECEVFIANMGGAVSLLPDDATAYMGRDAKFIMNVHARWQQPEDDERFTGWARELHSRTERFASAGAYVNFLTQDEQERVQSAYGPNHERLATIKARLDPDNLFRVNQNIAPASSITEHAADVRQSPEIQIRR